MSGAVKNPPRMSVAEFLAWESADGLAWQRVDGEPQAMAPANRTHGALQNEPGSRHGRAFGPARHDALPTGAGLSAGAAVAP